MLPNLLQVICRSARLASFGSNDILCAIYVFILSGMVAELIVYSVSFFVGSCLAELWMKVMYHSE